jgi:Ser-tRNA(Ala) deacylase AlaX
MNHSKYFPKGIQKMKTDRIYYFSDAFTTKAVVTTLTRNGAGGFVILDRTVFVPQGGGQPADNGSIGNAVVTHVEAAKDASNAIIHTVSRLDGLAEGGEVDIRIDVQRRQLHSRLHSSGHLIAAIVEELLPSARACGGHHWPGEARVEFSFEGSLPESFSHRLSDVIANAISADHNIQRTLALDGERYVQIATYPALRCGGTHCAHLKEIGGIVLRGIKQKKDRLRIGYDVSDDQPKHD